MSGVMSVVSAGLTICPFSMDHTSKPVVTSPLASKSRLPEAPW
jgi:hypothetical protein